MFVLANGTILSWLEKNPYCQRLTCKKYVVGVQRIIFILSLCSGLLICFRFYLFTDSFFILLYITVRYCTIKS